MVVLFNYLPMLLMLIGVCFIYYFSVHKLNAKGALITLGVMVLVYIALAAITPSYLPKGSVHKTANVEFEESNAEIQDRLRVARPEEEHDARLDEGLDWKEKAEKSKQEAEARH